MKWTVYLSGEIHTDWRDQIIAAVEQLELPIEFCSAVTQHEASDAAGDHLGNESDPFWRDHKSAKVNAIRSKNLLDHADIAVIRFGGYWQVKNTELVKWTSQSHATALLHSVNALVLRFR